MSDISYTSEQQEHLNQLLAEERRRGEANAEEVRRIARQQIEEATGKPVSERDFLANEAAKLDAGAARLAELERLYFGSGPGCGQRSQALFKSNPAQYRALKAEFEALKNPNIARARQEAAKHKSNTKLFLD